MAADWRSIIAYGRNPRPSKSELVRIGNDWGVRFHGLRSRIYDDHGFGSRKSTEAVSPETGFVVAPGDIDGVISAIEEIRSRGKSAFAAACRSRALALFRKEDRFAEYLRLYEEVSIRP